jgi:hypothetical protein
MPAALRLRSNGTSTRASPSGPFSPIPVRSRPSRTVHDILLDLCLLRRTETSTWPTMQSGLTRRGGYGKIKRPRVRTREELLLRGVMMQPARTSMRTQTQMPTRMPTRMRTFDPAGSQTGYGEDRRPAGRVRCPRDARTRFRCVCQYGIRRHGLVVGSASGRGGRGKGFSEEVQAVPRQGRKKRRVVHFGQFRPPFLEARPQTDCLSLIRNRAT